MAARCGSTWPRCTATSRASGWAPSKSFRASPRRGTGRSAATTSTPSSGTRTAAVTILSDSDGLSDSESRIARFDAVERALHWANAALFLVLMSTAAVLYVGPLEALVGRRQVVRDIHVWSGLLLPIPLLAALVGPWRRALRADIRQFNRWDHDTGKFNRGQKLNAAFTAGAIPV